MIKVKVPRNNIDCFAGDYLAMNLETNRLIKHSSLSYEDKKNRQKYKMFYAIVSSEYIHNTDPLVILMFDNEAAKKLIEVDE